MSTLPNLNRRLAQPAGSFITLPLGFGLNGWNLGDVAARPLAALTRIVGSAAVAEDIERQLKLMGIQLPPQPTSTQDLRVNEWIKGRLRKEGLLQIADLLELDKGVLQLAFPESPAHIVQLSEALWWVGYSPKW